MVGHRSKHRKPACGIDPLDAPAIRAEDEPAFRAAVPEGIEAAGAGPHSPSEAVAEWLTSPLVLNAETIEAMREARRGGLVRFSSARALLADLNAED